MTLIDVVFCIDLVFSFRVYSIEELLGICCGLALPSITLLIIVTKETLHRKQLSYWIKDSVKVRATVSVIDKKSQVLLIGSVCKIEVSFWYEKQHIRLISKRYADFETFVGNFITVEYSPTYQQVLFYNNQYEIK